MSAPAARASRRVRTLPEPPAPPAGPEVAVIVPAYGQPHFLSESVASVLGQEGAPDWRLIVVDDGCPSPETAELGLSFALADPRIRYVRTPNRGLSGARNLGIARALAEWPGVQALHMLDADNRMTPTTLARGYAALRADPGLSFVYPQLEKFGITWSGHVDVPVSLLHVLMQGNFIEASSLIHRRVFEAGVRYDEAMRDGYEDWEFWIQVVAAGFRGRCVPEMGLDYRYRPESMVRGSARQRPILLDALHRRHRSLHTAASLLALEQAHHPRYAMLGTHGVERFTDPSGPSLATPRASFTEELWRSLAEPERIVLPPYLLFAEPSALAALRSAGLAQGLLRRLESACDDAGGRAGIVLDPGDNLGPTEEAEGEPSAILVSTRAFAEAVAAVAEPDAFLAAMSLTGFTVPAGWARLPPASGHAATALAETLAHCREESRGWERPERWHWQTVTLPDSAGLVSYLRREIRGAPLSTISRAPGVRTLCLAADAGTLAAAAPLAAFCTERGLALHVVLLAPAPDLAALEPFRSAASFDLVTLPTPTTAPFRYFGQGIELPEPDDAAWDEMRGALAGYDVLLCASPRLFSLLADIRKGGTRTLVVAQPDAFASPGADQVLLAFEHAMDGLVLASRSQANRLLALGFPEAKTHVASDDPESLSILLG